MVNNHERQIRKDNGLADTRSPTPIFLVHSVGCLGKSFGQVPGLLSGEICVYVSVILCSSLLVCVFVGVYSDDGYYMNFRNETYNGESFKWTGKQTCPIESIVLIPNTLSRVLQCCRIVLIPNTLSRVL